MNHPRPHRTVRQHCLWKRCAIRLCRVITNTISFDIFLIACRAWVCVIVVSGHLEYANVRSSVVPFEITNDAINRRNLRFKRRRVDCPVAVNNSEERQACVIVAIGGRCCTWRAAHVLIVAKASAERARRYRRIIKFRAAIPLKIVL